MTSPPDRHQQALELERERQKTAQMKVRAERDRAAQRRADAAADARQKAVDRRKAALKSIPKRQTVGRASSNTKILGDTFTTMGAGLATGGWIATRPGTQWIYWGIGLTGAGALAMLESQPGTFLESTGAGVIAASATVTLLRALGLAR